jgi:O-antigen/teichoic acid export membrane protein
MLTPDDFGLYAAVMIVFNLCVTVSTVGLDLAAVQSKDESEELLRTAATFRMTMAIIAVIAALMLAPVIASFFVISDMTNPLRVTTIAILISSAGFVSTVRLTKALRFRELSISRIGYAVTWPAVAVLAGVIGFTYWSMIVANLLANVIALALLWVYAPWRISFHIDKTVLAKLLHYGKFPVATGVVVFLFFNLDKVVVGRLLGAELLGLYFMAFTWGTMVPGIFTGIVNNVMFPTYSRISHDRDLLSKGYLKTLTYLGYLSLPMGFGLAAISPIFVAAILGTKWTAATGSLAVLSLVGTCSALTSPAGSLFLATGNPYLSWRQTAICFVIYVVLLVPATIYGGILGVSSLMLAITLISVLWVWHMASGLANEPLSTIGKLLWKPAFASVAMAAIVYWSSTLVAAGLVTLIVLVALGIATYGAIVYALNMRIFGNEARSLIRLFLGR